MGAKVSYFTFQKYTNRLTIVGEMTQPGEENTHVFLVNLHTMHCNDGEVNQAVMGNDKQIPFEIY